jgi:hypothetical protein
LLAPGAITVKALTDPPESPTTGTEFEFHRIGLPTFTLRHDGTRTFDVPPGTYAVDELPSSGHDLTAIACDDSDSSGSTAERRATFQVAVDEHVPCTFTNKKL